MIRATMTVLAGLSLVAPTALAQSIGDRCVVADPTNTPLNVRAGPNGRKLDALLNGSDVRVVDVTRDAKGRLWARVSVFGATVGWVFAPYLDC